MNSKAQPLQVTYRLISELRPYARNARTHSKAQVRDIARSIEALGFNDPVAISDTDEIIAGHGRVEAAKLLGLTEVPTIRLSHLSEAERRTYILAANKLALKAGWAPDILATELQGIIDLGFDVELSGFALAEIDFTLDAARDRDPKAKTGAEDVIPALPAVAITRPGDLWLAGRHKLLCGDARDGSCLAALMGEERADIIFTDPPYNVVIDGNVCGSGRVRHPEFAMAAGEMSSPEFTDFLAVTLGHMAAHARDGAIAYCCMDWRHMEEMVVAGRRIFSELKNVCVWNKTNGGMGAFYRSKHEFVFVFKVGSGEHVNTFGLGGTGRPRSNVWDYAGISSISSTRGEELAMHPTVKPTALVADALRDCSKRGAIVLDAFGGSGTTLIAAEACGRSARLIEYDPVYCDTILQRFERVTGKLARLADTGASFEDVAAARAQEAAA